MTAQLQELQQQLESGDPEIAEKVQNLLEKSSRP